MIAQRRPSAREWHARLISAGVPGALVAPLARYLDLLTRWSEVVDLTARRDPDAIVSCDVLGALAGVPYLPSQGTLLDVGSGNGFPAVPLLLSSATLNGTLLEPRERRWAFLCEVVRELGVRAEVRRETVAGHTGGPYEAISLRGVRIESWQPLVERLLVPGGSMLWWSGAGAEETARRWRGGSVITSLSVPPACSRLVVWRRCST